jgi:predicted Zn finger-like uncharacterized protein
MFKVVPDQLRMSEGWVRCGQCNEVFDANANLFNDMDTAIAAGTPPAPPVQDPWVESLKFATQKADTNAKPTTKPLPEKQPLPEPPLPHTPSEPDEPQVDSFLSQSPLELSGNAEDKQPRYEQSESSLDEADGGNLTFMRNGAANGFWQRPPVRMALAVASVILLAVLCIQFLVHERDRMAAGSAQAKQFFTAACSVMGCKVAPLRHIESVVIDSSSFTKVRGDVYKLSFTLKNSGLVEVATPAVEITLTDLQDQPVIRRVLQYSEFGSKNETMAAGSELSAVLPVSTKIASTERIAGYRLLAFYP